MTPLPSPLNEVSRGKSPMKSNSNTVFKIMSRFSMQLPCLKFSYLRLHLLSQKWKVLPHIALLFSQPNLRVKDGSEIRKFYGSVDFIEASLCKVFADINSL